MAGGVIFFFRKSLFHFRRIVLSLGNLQCIFKSTRDKFLFFSIIHIYLSMISATISNFSKEVENKVQTLCFSFYSRRN